MTWEWYIAVGMVIFILVVFAIGLGIFSREGEDIIYDFQSGNDYLSSMEKSIFELVNQHRVLIGIRPLFCGKYINQMAAERTGKMVFQGYASHSGSALVLGKLIAKGATAGGENVAYGHGTAQGVFNHWMKSDGHRKKIEDPKWTMTGLRVQKDGRHRNYFCQIFIK